MKYGSVCSGIEAASVAWEPLGWEPAFFAEIEPFPASVLANRFDATAPLRLPRYGKMWRAPSAKKMRAERDMWRKLAASWGSKNQIPNFGDFTEIRREEVGKLDLLVGGTPCQDFSVAGKRAGFGGARGSLTFAFVELVRRLVPRWFVWENVPGVLSGDCRRGFFRFLREFNQLGYCCAWRVLDAQYVRVDGLERAVPQRRRRVFVVGYLGDWRPSAAVLFEPESLRGDSPPRREAGQGFARDVAGSLGASGARSGSTTGDTRGQDNVVCMPILEAGARTNGDGYRDGDGIGHAGDPMYTLQARHQHAVAIDSEHNACRVDGVIGTLCKGSPFGGGQPLPAIAQCQYGEVAGALTHRHDSSPCADRGQNVVCAVSPTLRAGENSTGGDRPPGTDVDTCESLVVFTCKDNGRDCNENISPTLRSMNGERANGGGQLAVASGVMVRRLTPRECERLQGFPDDWTLIPYRGRAASRCPDGPRYKALGNTMSVNCMRWIGTRIHVVELLMRQIAAGEWGLNDV